MAAPKKPSRRSRSARKASGQRQQTTQNQQTSTPHSGAGQAIPVVGIGASAGGLAACHEWFTAMPGDTGMAFVLIQHLSPDDKSLTAELLGRYTDMPVIEVEDRMRVEANHVYLILPHQSLSMSDSELCLTAPVARRGMRMPSDFFFSSLAEERSRAIVDSVPQSIAVVAREGNAVP